VTDDNLSDMQKILLVEDDPQITRLLGLHLEGPVYTLIACSRGSEAMEKLATNLYDLIILDIMLPDLSGLALCRQLRARKNDTPIMMLTSLADESDKVLALEIGADDYVTKPFGMLELLARTKALLRRRSDKPAAEGPNQLIRHKELVIDKEKRMASIRGSRLELTLKEFDLLSLLASHPGKAFSRRELLELVWGFSFQGYEHTVTAHINRLRIKIESNVNTPEYILTSWGIGYRFTE
jgi:DNA-binding response OmpR family regulator